MGPMLQDDGSSVTSSSPLQFFSRMSPNLGTPHPWLRELKPEERGLYLIHLLLTCANHVSNGSLDNANLALEHISHLATPDAVFELFPFLKLAFVVTNQSIIESMEGEKMVHIIDLNASEPAQWIALIQALSARPEGPPHLRITGVHQQKEVLEQVAHRLTDEAEKLDLPFQFNPIVSKLENLDVEKLRVKTGEALAISSVLQLHTLLASEDETLRKSSSSSFLNHTNGVIRGNANRRSSPSNDSASSSPTSISVSAKMDGFLAALWGLSPKIMRSKNIISCEGAERSERHEKLERWIQRFDMAGFGTVPLSYM
ncbi:Scarecrow-like protein 3, partial [Bienertia sinuspersici]